MSITDRETDTTYHDVGGGSLLECKYHTRVWEGKTTEQKRATAEKFFLDLSPYATNKPTFDERRKMNEIHHGSDVYCGAKQYIAHSIVYEKCPNKPRGYTSPYNYHSIGPSSLCFLKGRGVVVKDQEGKEEVKEEKEVKYYSPVPPAIYPEVPPPDIDQFPPLPHGFVPSPVYDEKHKKHKHDKRDKERHGKDRHSKDRHSKDRHSKDKHDKSSSAKHHRHKRREHFGSSVHSNNILHLPTPMNTNTTPTTPTSLTPVITTTTTTNPTPTPVNTNTPVTTTTTTLTPTPTPVNMNTPVTTTTTTLTPTPKPVNTNTPMTTKTTTLTPTPTPVTTNTPVTTKTATLTPTTQTPVTDTKLTTTPMSTTAPTFELEKQTLPQISNPMSTRVIQWDQPITPENMESEWQQFLMSIKDHMHVNVYAPLESYYTDKISHLTNDHTHSHNKRESIFQCIRKTELDIRKWLEPQKRLLMYKNGRNASDGYVDYIKASFSESMDQLAKVFRDEWMVKIADCYRQSTDQMKNLASSVNRTIKAPLAMSEKQSQMMRVMDIRGDPTRMTYEQNQIYEKTVSDLLEEMKNVPFSVIEPRLEPVSNLNPFLDEIWSQMQRVYSGENNVGNLNRELDHLYESIKSDNWNEHLFNFIVTLDRNRRKSYWQSVLDLSSDNNNTNTPDESVKLKKQFIYNGEFTKFLTNLYAPHQATLETYIKTMVPVITKQWLQSDMDAIANNARVAERKFKLLHKVYHERFPNETFPSATSLSWLSQAINMLHNHNSKENMDQLKNEWLSIK